MLFLIYWELNENMAHEERLRITQRLTAAGVFPLKGVKVLRWDATPDAWGVLLLEANDAADVILAVDTWRAAGAGFFKLTKTAPAMPVADVLPLEEGLSQSVSARSG